MAEVQKDHCKETIEKLFDLSNVTVAFVEIDANKDNIITKKEGQDAMKNFDRARITLLLHYVWLQVQGTVHAK